MKARVCGVGASIVHFSSQRDESCNLKLKGPVYVWEGLEQPALKKKASLWPPLVSGGLGPSMVAVYQHAVSWLLLLAI